MLRFIVGVRRRPSETWVEYMQRSTWRSEELAAKYKLTDWCDLQRKRKQQMVQKVRTMQSDRWPAAYSNGRHGFAQTQQEVRDVPRSDGVTYRIF